MSIMRFKLEGSSNIMKLSEFMDNLPKTFSPLDQVLSFSVGVETSSKLSRVVAPGVYSILEHPQEVYPGIPLGRHTIHLERDSALFITSIESKLSWVSCDAAFTWVNGKKPRLQE